MMANVFESRTVIEELGSRRGLVNCEEVSLFLGLYPQVVYRKAKAKEIPIFECSDASASIRR